MYRRASRALASPPRTRSPTLPLDENADGQHCEDTNSKRLTSIHDVACREHRVNVARKVSTLKKLPQTNSKARSVLSPSSSIISKRSPPSRSLRRRTSKDSYEAKKQCEDIGKSDKTRPDQARRSHLTSLEASQPRQGDQPSKITKEPSSHKRQLQPHRVHTALHPETAPRTTGSRTELPKSNRSAKIDADVLRMSTIRPKRQRKPAEKLRHSNSVKKQVSPQELRTKSGRVSKRSERFGFAPH